MAHERFHYKTLEDVQAKASELGASLPFARDTSALTKPLQVGSVALPNRLGVAPMEGADSTPEGAPSDYTTRRYVNEAIGGSAAIWFEAISIVEEGRSSQTQLLLTRDTLEAFQKLTAAVKEAGMKAKGTLEKYRIVYKHLQEFLDIRYHVKDIALKELTPAFISDFEMFLRTDKHCCTNTVWLYVCPLRTMVFIAINNEWLTRDPFREYEIKKEETTRSFLTKDEIRLLMEGKLKNAKQELYRDLYLFCAFTGLSFADMRNLTEENIRTYFDEHEWININRQKTGVVSNIRLLDIANRIIGKYRGLCENGRIFPVPHYNTCLAGIRAVAKRCGITKHITWHQSRHTAATTIFLSNGVPIETVSSMLGHKSIKTTQIYAKITKEKLNQDMENLAARLNGVEEFAGCTI